jgi:hypothetical protein
MRIAAVTHDPGGANAVAAVIAALGAADVAIDAHAKGPAARRLAEMGVACHAFEGDHAQVVSGLDADLLLTGTSAADCFELDAIAAFAARGLPTLAVLDYPANYAQRFHRAARHGCVAPDFVATLDEASAAAMVSSGIAADRILPLGQPYLGWLLRRDARRQTTPRRQGPRRILFASQPDAHELEALRLVVASLGQLDRRPALTLRFHPRQTERMTSLACLAAAGIDAVVDDQTPTLACIEAHDVVLGITSTILIEAALLGRPTASVLAGEIDDPLAAIRPGLIPTLRSAPEIRHFLESSPGPRATSPFTRAQCDADRRVARLCRALAHTASETR